MKILFQISFLNTFIFVSLCQKSCIELNSSPGLCYQCSFTHFQRNLTDSGSLYPINCSLRNNTSMKMSIFITTKKCLSVDQCDGSELYPFDEINKAFMYANTQANEVTYSTIDFFLLGSPHYMLLKNLPTKAFTYFRRLNASISIQTCLCSFRNITGCFLSNERTTIHLKTDNFFIFVAYNLLVSRITFNGSDIHISNTTENNTNSCYNKEASCCFSNNLSLPENTLNNPCGLLNKYYSIDKPETWNFRYGLFNIEPFLDDPFPSTPTLQLDGVAFTNIYLARTRDSWIALIGMGTNAGGFLLVKDTILNNSLLLQGLLLMKSLQYFYPKLLETKLYWLDPDEANKNIQFINISINSYNFYDNKITSYDQTTLGVFSADSYLGTFMITYACLTGMTNGATKISFFLLVRNKIIVTNSSFIDTNNFQFANLLESQLLVFYSNITGFRYYRGVNMTKSSYLGIFSSNITNVVALDPSNQNFIVSSSSKLTLTDSLISNLHNFLRTSTSSSLLINRNLIQNLVVNKNFLQLRDTDFAIVATTFQNITILNITYKQLIYAASELPYNGSIINVVIIQFTNIESSTFFSSVGGFTDIGFLIQNITIRDSLIGTVFNTDKIKWLHIGFITIVNSSISESQLLILGTSVLYVTYFSYLLIENISVSGLFSKDQLIYASYCLLLTDCELTMQNAFLSELSHYSSDWIFLSLAKITLKTIYVQNIRTWAPNLLSSGLNINIANYITIEFFTILVKETFFNYLFEIYECTNATLTNLLIQNYKQTTEVILSIITAVKCESVYFDNLIIENLKGDASETSILRKNGFLNFIGFESELIGNENNKQVLMTNLIFQNSGGWPNGIAGFTNIHLVALTNASFSNCFSIKYGGAVYLNWANTFIIENISLHLTRAHKGGALYLKNIQNLTINNLNARESSAIQDGGLLFGMNLLFGNFTNFSINQANAGKNGGALCVENCNVKLVNFNCEWCYSKEEGGVVFQIKGNFIHQTGYYAHTMAYRGAWAGVKSAQMIDVDDLRLLDSLALEKATSLYSFECEIICIRNSLFGNHQGEETLGNIYVESQKKTNLTVYHLECIKNDAKTGSCIYYNTVGHIALNTISIAGSSGNALFFNSKTSSSISIEHIIMANNNLKENLSIAQQVYLVEFTNSFLKITGSNLFHNNRANKAVIHFFKVNSTLEGCIFINNNPIKNSSSEVVILLIEFSYFQAYNLIQSQNKGSSQMISFFRAFNSNLSFSNFKGFYCKTNEGCMITENCAVNLSNCTFTNNIGNNAATLNIKNSRAIINSCSFLKNQILLEGNYYSQSWILLEPSELRASDILFTVTNNNQRESFPLKIISSYFFIPNHSVATYYASSIEVSLSFFFNGSHKCSSLFVYSGTLIVQSSSFIGFNYYEGAAIRFYNLESNLERFIISYTTLMKCVSNLGGAIFLQGAIQSSINNCIFNKNSAEGKLCFGGAIYFVCKYCHKVWMALSENIFVNNKASGFGAALLSQGSLNKSLLNTNLNALNYDSLGLGRDFFSFPTSLKVNASVFEDGIEIFWFNDRSQNETLSIISGIPFKIKLSVVDSFETQIYFDNITLSSIKKSTEISQYVKIEGGQSASLLGLHEFTKIQLNFMPSSTLSLVAEVNFDERKLLPRSLEVHSENQLFINLPIYARPCKIGEVFKKGELSCFKCPPEEFSLINPQVSVLKEDSQQACIPCLEKAVCEGGDSLSPVAGYWRANRTSTKIIKCLSELYCLGGLVDGLNATERVHGACRIRHKGPMCYYCESGYAKDNRRGVCEECSSNYSIHIKLIIGVIFVVIYVYIQVIMSISKESRGSIGILMKQFLTHIQILHLISSINLSWTQELTNFFKLQDYILFISEEIIPLDCMFEIINGDLLEIKVIAANLVPVIMGAFFSTSILIIRLIKNNLNKNIRKNTDANELLIIKAGSVIIFYVFFPDILNKAFTLLNCILIDDTNNIEVLIYSPDDRCWDAKHYESLLKVFLPTILISALFVPLVGLALMVSNSSLIKKYILERRKSGFLFLNKMEKKVSPYKHAVDRNNFLNSSTNIINEGQSRISNLEISRAKLNEKALGESIMESSNLSVKKLNYSLYSASTIIQGQNVRHEAAIALRFLYRGYRENLYFWEYIIFLRKFILILISSFSELFPEETKFNVLLVLFTVFLVLQIRYKPFEIPFLNKVEYFSLLVSFFTTNVGILLYSPELERWSTFFFYFLLFLNISFIIYWLWAISKPVLGLLELFYKKYSGRNSSFRFLSRKKALVFQSVCFRKKK